MLECVLDDRELPEKQSYEETIFSKIQHQLSFAHDADWLGEVVYNLLDNGVKYSKICSDTNLSGESGGTEILLGAEQNEMFVRIWVRDYGTCVEIYLEK